MGCIYAILNTIDNKKYIGSAKNIKDRIRVHLYRLRKNSHHSPYLQRAWNKYGKSAFCFIVIEDGVDENDLISREQWWLDREVCEYNCEKKAGSSLGIKRRKETREKVRQANLGLVHPKWRRKLKSIAQGGKNHWAYGKKMKRSTRAKKSRTMLKKYKEGWIAPNTKPVVKFSVEGKYIQAYKSVIEAAGYIEKKRKAITNCLIGKNKTALGFKWKYKNK